jgi:F-type H+-transporting ATPase subunit epsilon
MPLQVDLVSPERTLLSAEAVMVQARTLGGGDIAFLPGHAPFIGALDTWTVSVRLIDGTDRQAAVHGGFVEVSGDNVKILSDLAELSDQIDIDRATRAAERAEVTLRQGEDVEAEAALRRAHARLRAAGQET